MKKLFFLAAIAVTVFCACSNPHERADRLIGEYEQKTRIAAQELSKMDVDLSSEEEAFVEAFCRKIGFMTAAAVAKNWQLSTDELQYEAGKWGAKAEELKVPLSDEKMAYLEKYAEVKMYGATVEVLKRWKQLN